jgi:hypothetical protein
MAADDLDPLVYSGELKERETALLRD